MANDGSFWEASVSSFVMPDDDSLSLLLMEGLATRLGVGWHSCLLVSLGKAVAVTWLSTCSMSLKRDGVL